MNADAPQRPTPAPPCPDEPSLRELLPRVRQHDESASRQLVERLYPLVARLVQANLPRREEPEDLMQEIFMKIFSRLEQYRADAPFEHWVSRMTVTTCLDRLRKQRVRPELRWADLSEEEQQMVENSPADVAPESADKGSAYRLMEKLLAQMPAADAWLIRQVELDQKPLQEVCALTGWNAGAARVRLFRARHRLRQAFRQLEKLKPSHET